MWQEEDNKLKSSFTFKDFEQAMEFMQEVAVVAGEMDHHPWWSNMYNKVDIELSTHDAGNTVTIRDHKLATRIEEIYKASYESGVPGAGAD
ncbi:4a-hydroxytetrahydrobiopterin dehydratase [Pontibacter sp. E15-1]|uniref:4a-hydroxytetrahydrobiopterin dehydratase n=1 Tax=Pontibacter sp. E15-1 TaxID=2919918 RepID=UPI001F50003F|nr:4a-hydroxytetrahydrobiopterin dehydratase [Pontibacter sp. E15-1]MCJ8163818.1 4a-hydroxytetrahydrobiopterin dehydratase [Pontibacter sp. E15-1]